MTDAVAVFLQSMVTPRRRSPPRLAEPLRDAEIQRVDTPFGAVAAWRVGEGPAALLVHGWEDDNSLWATLIPALRANGRAVLAFDLPAHGYSEGDWGMGWEATDATRAVASHLGPIHCVVGHSMGAGSAALAIMEGLSVHCSVLISPALAPSTVDRWRRNAERQGLPPSVAERAKRIYESRVGAARVSGFNLREQLGLLGPNVLLVHSKHDEHMPFEHALEAAALHANVQLLQVEGLGHRQTARDPEVVSKIAAFIGA